METLSIFKCLMRRTLSKKSKSNAPKSVPRKYMFYGIFSFKKTLSVIGKNGNLFYLRYKLGLLISNTSFAHGKCILAFLESLHTKFIEITQYTLKSTFSYLVFAG
jgi:hypothetical protein